MTWCACGLWVDICGPMGTWPPQMLGHVRTPEHQRWSRSIAEDDPAQSTQPVPSGRQPVVREASIAGMDGYERR